VRFLSLVQGQRSGSILGRYEVGSSVAVLRCTCCTRHRTRPLASLDRVLLPRTIHPRGCRSRHRPRVLLATRRRSTLPGKWHRHGTVRVRILASPCHTYPRPHVILSNGVCGSTTSFGHNVLLPEDVLHGLGNLVEVQVLAQAGGDHDLLVVGEA